MTPGVREAHAATVATLLFKAREWDRIAEGQEAAGRWCEAQGYRHGYNGPTWRVRATEARERAARLQTLLDA